MQGWPCRGSSPVILQVLRWRQVLGFHVREITQNPETWLKSLEFLQVISDNQASFRTFTIHGIYKQVGQNNIWAMCLSALDPVPTDCSERAVCLHGASQTMISANLSLRTFQTEGPTQMWLWNMTFLIKYSRCKSESFTYYLNINERRKNCVNSIRELFWLSLRI